MNGTTPRGGIVVDGSRCHGCLTCEYRCSLRAVGTFNPPKSRINVSRDERSYTYRHRFTDECDECGGEYLCVRWCPYGALQRERS